MSFKELLLEAIDDALVSLGESAKQAFYYHLEETFNIKRQDIPYKIEKFTDAIERIFGAGAKILEIEIIKCLFKKGGYTFNHSHKLQNLEFIEYIRAVKLAETNVGNIRGHYQADCPYEECKKKMIYLPTR